MTTLYNITIILLVLTSVLVGISSLSIIFSYVSLRSLYESIFIYLVKWHLLYQLILFILLGCITRIYLESFNIIPSVSAEGMSNTTASYQRVVPKQEDP